MITQTVAFVYRQRSYRWLGGLLFLGFLALYLFLLPGAYTGGKVGLISLRYLNGALVFFSIALAALVSLTLTVNAYNLKLAASASGRSQAAGVVSLFASIIPGMLCCTPLVPTALALLGASMPTVFGISGKIQGFFATYELHMLTGALILLLYAFYRSVEHLNTTCSIKVESSHQGE